jgi:hypothetical protein
MSDGSPGQPPQQEQSPPPEQKTPEFKPVTYSTQAELDAAFAERAARAASSAVKPIEDLGIGVNDALQIIKDHQAAEEAKKDPATKEREARQRAEQELAEYKSREARANLAAEIARTLKVGDTPLPAELLTGNTREEMISSGQALVNFIGGLVSGVKRPPGHNPLQGNNDNGKTATGDPLRNYFSTGSFT